MPHKPRVTRTIKLPGTDKSVSVQLSIDIDDRFILFIDTKNIDIPSMRVYLNRDAPDLDYTAYDPLQNNDKYRK